jgi:polar amino acid transport system permease protein
MSYRWQFGLVWPYRDAFVAGALITLKMSALSILLALLMGLFWGIARHSRRRVLNVPATIVVEIFRDTPVLVQMFWIFYCLPILVGVRIESFASAVAALALYYSVYVGEIVRAGIEAVDRGLIEVGRTLGMSHGQVLRRVSIPLAVRTMLPPLVNECTALVKSSAAASFLAVPELLHSSNDVNLTLFRPMEVFTVCALAYLLLIAPLVVFSRVLEGRQRA